MKKINSIMVSVVMLIALVGCSQETVEVTTTTKPSTTVTATTTTTTTTAVVTTTTTQPQTTKAETTSITKQTTTKPITTKPKPTTEKATTRKATTTATTQKQTTTKKVTTNTSDCKGKNDHWMPCGNVGKWYNSKEDFKAEYMAESDKWTAKLDNEEIDWDTYIHSVAGGYELWSCPNCGKWTGNYKYR